jgi:hypothetical protein
MSRGKGATRAGFQIALESESGFTISEGHGDFKFPWAVFGGVRAMTCIVIHEALLHVFSEPNVVLCRM